MTHLAADVLHQIIETLEPRQQIVLKMRFDLRMGAKEIQSRMGVTEKRLEKIFTETYRAIAEQLETSEGGVTRWSRRQRSLLLACELGIATPEQRERAQQLLNRDPQCRSMLHAMRSTLRDVAVVLPMPPVAYGVDDGRRPFSALLDWVGQGLGPARHQSAELAAARTAGSTLSEQASGSLLGGLGLGGAVKVVAACLAVGGAAAVCVTGSAPPSQRPVRSAPTVARKPVDASRPVVVPVVQRSTAQPVTGQRVRLSPSQVAARAKQRAAAQRLPSSSPAATAPVSPAPVGATEFGPGAGGSAPVAPAPAAAPQDGGGEFGP